MARDEQIKDEALRRYPIQHPFLEISKESFIEGAKWADQTMIDRACEWLKENIDLYSYNAFNTKSGYTEIKLTDVFETAFRKAMEGGAE